MFLGIQPVFSDIFRSLLCHLYVFQAEPQNGLRPVPDAGKCGYSSQILLFFHGRNIHPILASEAPYPDVPAKDRQYSLRFLLPKTYRSNTGAFRPFSAYPPHRAAAFSGSARNSPVLFPASLLPSPYPGGTSLPRSMVHQSVSCQNMPDKPF